MKIIMIMIMVMMGPRPTIATRQRRASSLLVPLPGMDSHWKFASCLRIMTVCSPYCLRLICNAVVKLGAPLSRFLEGAP